MTLQPVDGEEGVEDEEDGGKVAGTRKGYVGIYVGAAAVVTGAANSSATLTTPTTGAATAGYFMVDTKQGMIKIHTPNVDPESFTDGIESFAQTTSRQSDVPKNGDRVVVLVEFEDQDGELVKVAVWLKVKPTKPLQHTVGAVVGIATGENGVRTVGRVGDRLELIAEPASRGADPTLVGLGLRQRVTGAEGNQPLESRLDLRRRDGADDLVDRGRTIGHVLPGEHDQ